MDIVYPMWKTLYSTWNIAYSKLLRWLNPNEFAAGLPAAPLLKNLNHIKFDQSVANFQGNFTIFKIILVVVLPVTFPV